MHPIKQEWTNKHYSDVVWTFVEVNKSELSGVFTEDPLLIRVSTQQWDLVECFQYCRRFRFKSSSQLKKERKKERQTSKLVRIECGCTVI